MWSPSNRTPRAPSRGALKLFEKFEQRQPPSPKRRLSASRRVAKNQCADKGFPIADRRRVRERQFALSCAPRPPRSSPSSVAGSQGPTSKPTGSRYSRRFTTKRSSGHCGGSSNSACPDTSASGRFIAKEPPRLWQLTCEAPHCLRAKRAFAIAIVTRRAETPVGWLGEERSDE